MQCDILRVLIRLGDKEEHAGNQIDTESQDAPRKQPVQRRKWHAFHYAQHSKIDDNHGAEQEREAYEMKRL